MVLRPSGMSLSVGDVRAWMLADPEGALLEVVSAGAWLLAGWLFLVTGLSLLSAATGATGRMARQLARLVTPIALRRTLEASLGLTLAIGPAGAAMAGPSQTTPASSVSTQGTASSTGVILNALTPPPAPIVASAEPPILGLDRPDVSVAPLPPAATTPSPAATSPPSPAAKTHTVLAGDTLWAIAASDLAAGATPAEITLAWQHWYGENRALIGSDPALIVPGQVLVDHHLSR